MAKAFPNTGVTTGTAADRAALSGVFAGMQVFETDTNTLYIYNGSSWVDSTNQYAVKQALQAQSTQITVNSTTWTTIVSQSITTSKNNSKLLVMFTGDCNALSNGAWKRVGIYLDSTLQYYVISATADAEFQEVIHMSSLITVPTVGTVTVSVQAQQGALASNFAQEGGDHKNNLIVLELL